MTTTTTYQVRYTQRGINGSSGKTGRDFAGRNAKRDAARFANKLRHELKANGYWDLAETVKIEACNRKSERPQTSAN